MRKPTKVIFYILLVTFFLICLAPDLFVLLVTGHLDAQLRNLYWERRMQAIALFVGVGLIISGLNIVRKKQIAWRFHYFGKRSGEVTLIGKEAVRNGIFTVLIGIVATAWSIPFWIRYVIPIILYK